MDCYGEQTWGYSPRLPRPGRVYTEPSAQLPTSRMAFRPATLRRLLFISDTCGIVYLANVMSMCVWGRRVLGEGGGRGAACIFQGCDGPYISRLVSTSVLYLSAKVAPVLPTFNPHHTGSHSSPFIIFITTAATSQFGIPQKFWVAPASRGCLRCLLWMMSCGSPICQ